MTDRTISSLVKDGVSYLADLIARIVSGIRDIAPLALVLSGCQAGSVDAAIAPAPTPREAAAAVKLVPTEPEGPKPIGSFNITFYYVIAEEEVVAKAAALKAAKAAKAANDNHAEEADGSTELAAVAPRREGHAVQHDRWLRADRGGVSRVCRAAQPFRAPASSTMAGSSTSGGTAAATTPRASRSPTTQWGTAGAGKPLQPFRTVAVDPRVIKLGTLLYVPLLEGRTMPGRAPWGGFVHDGCVVADDTGGGIDGNQLDLFVGRKAYFLGISGSGGSHAWARHVPVFDGSKICERKGRRITKKAGAI